ncbi:MAG: hypothetical protein KFF50_12225 [Desulfatitalea sp.]|nr:hypothetical protein [Desulfatitalea sp.]
MEPDATLTMELPPATIGRFAALFGQGVGIPTRTGIPLLALLCDQLGIARDYIDQRVQTFFINGRAVDQVEQIRVGDRDVIALSAAMPGLAGATLRKGGMFAGFRQTISYAGGSGQEKAPQQTVVTLKLFNLVARELAAQILHTGVWVKGPRLAEYLQQLDGNALTDSVTMKWNDQPRDPGSWERLPWPEGWVALRMEPLRE